ncbi:MAG: cysteine peptidase family C39 domain-containing protein [Rhodospirillaceae bacterium]
MRGRRTPVVLQVEAVECGAAALGIILATHGRWVPLEELREACGVSRDGSRAASVLAAAEEYGLEAQAFRCEPDELAALPLPAIVFWDMNHFLVVEGRRGASWLLNDPAHGHRTVDAEEFSRGFTGIALTFRPGPGFQRGGRPPRALRAVAEVLAEDRTAALLLALTALALVVPGLAVPVAAKLFVDGFMHTKIDGWQPVLGQALAAGGVLAAAATWLQLDMLRRFEARVAVAGAGRFVARALRLPMTFFAQRSGGEVAARVGVADRVAVLATGPLARGVLDGAAAAVFLGAIALIDVGLAGLAALFGALTLGGLGWGVRGLATRGQIQLNVANRLRGTALQGLQMIDSLKAAGAEHALFDQLASLRARMLGQQQAAAGHFALLAGLPMALAIAAAAGVAVVGGQAVLAGRLSLGDVVAVQILMAAFLAPVAHLAVLAGPAQAARADLRLLDDAGRYPLDPEFEGRIPAGPVTGRLRGRVELRGVTFGYDRRAAPLLSDVSLVIEPGRRVGLVGASGSGKSTIGRLACGLYRPWQGQILFDGVPLEDVPRAVLRRSVSVVDQSVVLFEGSIRDNLTLWDDTLPDERLMDAARVAALADFIATRPGGTGALVSEGGRNLSGGQAARLEIARAVLQDPAVLILDEATATLDGETERTIVANLRRIGCTTLVIAHRLTTLRDCDEIIVLEGGRIVQRGAPADLLDAPGPFRALVGA